MLTPAVRRLNRRYAGGFNSAARAAADMSSIPRTSPSKSPARRTPDRLPDYIAENPPFSRPWPWSSYDVEFPFIQPLLWLERLESGSASPNQVRS